MLRRLLVVATLAVLGVLFAPQLAGAAVGTSINQCRNDATGIGDCTGSAWSNGDLNGSQTLYREGDTVPFRAIVTGLTAGSTYTLRIGWDAVEGDLHAYDYLRTFDASENAPGQDVVPCDGVSGCSGAGSTFPIPADTQMVMPDGNQQPGVFTIWNGTITAATYIPLPASITAATTGTVERQIDVTFTASASTVVLAWGGHIASLFDWGVGETFLSNRSGAPFHMRLKQIQTPDGLESIGNQDRSMQGGAIPPAVPSFTTQVSSSQINTGQTITDVATLTGSQDNGRPSGSVNFFLCGPNLTAGQDCTTGGVDLGSSTVQFADAQTLTGTATKTSGAITQPGHYCFRAEYHPDDAALYTGTFHTNSTTECFDVVTPAGQLIVKKVVVNDDGGTKVASDFSFSVDGGAAQAFDSDGQNELTVPGGSTHSVTEPAVTGYATTYDNCSNVTVPAGGSATCTITNDDQAATLIVKKVVVNDDGGTKVASDFSFKVNGGSAVSFEADGQNNLTVDAGTYSVTEPAVSGYTTTYDNCSNLVIPNGGSATCTVTNDDQAATLIVKKVVVNDDGGTKVASDFSFKVNGGSAVSFEADGQNNLTVDAGTYSVTEPAVSGYTTSYDNCADVVIPNGGTATCTVTNDDQPATLIVKKIVINDDGGTKAADDFSFKVNDGSAIGFEADGQNNLTVDAGTYSVVEPSVAGYATSYDNCADVEIPNGGTATCTITNDDASATLIVKKVVINDDGGTKAAEDFSFKVGDGPAVGFEADGQNDLTVDAGTYDVTEPAVAGYTTSYENCSDVEIPNGGTATCTITNDDQPGTLIVKKVVINDDGGTKAAEDFSFKVGDGDPVAFEADGQNDLTVDAGTYDVTEPSVAGYSTSYDNCSDVVVANGGTATCTVTNDDQAATLIVKKVVINDEGGTKAAEDFSFEVNDGSAIAFEADGQNDLGVPAGTYTVVEPAVAGYETSYANCTDVVIPNGGTATCTITNDDDIPPVVEVDKTASPTSLAEPGGAVTFSVSVHNASKEEVTLESLVDDVYGNLDGVGTCDVPQQLAADDGAAGGPDEYACSFEKTVSGNAGSTHTDTVTGTVRDDEGDTDSDDDDATVAITDVESSLEVTKTPSPSSLPEPGGDVTYTVTVKNTSAVDDVTITKDGFVDKVGAADPAAISDIDCAEGEGDGLPVTLEPGQQITCTFVKEVTGQPGDTIHDVVTVSGTDDDGHEVSGSDDADVQITDVPSSIDVQKDAGSSSVQEPGGDVTYTVTVKNTSATDTVTITGLTDDKFGDLDGKGTCDVPKTLAPGASFTCQFVGHVTGSGGGTHVNTVTASGHDDDEHPVSDSDDASVGITSAPPPPHQPIIDLAVTKVDTPDPVQLNGQLTYTMVVTNNGPDAATNVTAADALPAGTSFVSVGSTQGTCANNAGLIQCSIGTLAKGASATITLVVTATQAGTVTNTVTVVGKEPESNTANNTASAQTLVTAPVTPPVKPPKKPPVVCYTFTVSTKSMTVGKKTTLVVTVKNRGKAVRGAKVVVGGKGISKTARTGRDGKARIAITPKKAGIITVRVPQKIVCGARRIGVVGAFEPPVTG